MRRRRRTISERLAPYGEAPPTPIGRRLDPYRGPFRPRRHTGDLLHLLRRAFAGEPYRYPGGTSWQMPDLHAEAQTRGHLRLIEAGITFGETPAAASTPPTIAE